MEEMTTAAANDEPPAIADLYHVSYSYYSCLGFAGTLFVGLLVSLLSGGWRQRKEVDPSLLHFFFDHWLFSWLPKKFRSVMRCGVEQYNKVDEMITKEQVHVLRVSPDLSNQFEKPIAIGNSAKTSNGDLIKNGFTKDDVTATENEITGFSNAHRLTRISSSTSNRDSNNSFHDDDEEVLTSSL